MKKLYIGNLSFKSSESDLEQLVSPFGTVSNVTIIRDKMTSQSRGFGFVEMSNEDEATKVRDSLNGTEFQGRSLKIDLAREREPRDNDRGGSRYNGNSPHSGAPRGGNSRFSNRD